MNSAAGEPLTGNPPSPPDPHIASWILEFVLRQPVPDWLANEAFLALPVPAPLPPRLQKTVLLRRVASELSRRSVSERTLHSLELIEDLDRRTDGATPSELMRAAYCSISAECIAKSLRDSVGDFPHAVERIWDHRMADLERSEAAGLASSRLADWRKLMEEALVDPTVRDELLGRNTQDAALNAVKAYLKEAMTVMGPPFLELAAEAFQGEEMGATGTDCHPAELDESMENGTTQSMELNGEAFQGEEIGAAGTDRHPAELDESMGSGTTQFMELNGEAFQGKEMGAAGIDRHPAELDESMENGTTHFMELNGEAFQGKEMGATGTDRHPAELDESMENGTTHFVELNGERPSRSPGRDREKEGKAATGQDASKQDGHSTNKFNPLPTPEVSKVTMALKTSCVDLQMAVEDPLPDAIATADEVLNRERCDATNLEESRETNCRVDENASVCDAETGAGDSRVEGCGAGTMQNGDLDAVQLAGRVDPPPDPKELEGNRDSVVVNAPVQSAGSGAEVTRNDSNSTCIERNKDGLVPRPRLMDRNPTAHTYEWDDESIDSPSENSQSPSKELKLASPKRSAVSPLSLLENKRFLKRRKRKNWSLLEEDTLREAVKKHGVGNWKYILSCHTEIFEDRTEVDLKDKWRNMIRH